MIDPGTAVIGGAVIGGGMSMIGAGSANAKNADEARKARLFYRAMANTAHQREVADLRAAGLNPILSAGGNGANAAPTTAPTMQNEMEGMAASAMEMFKVKKEMEMQNAEVNLIEDQGKAAQAAAEKDSATAKMVEAQLPGEKAKSETMKTMMELVNGGGKAATALKEGAENVQRQGANPYHNFMPKNPKKLIRPLRPNNLYRLD